MKIALLQDEIYLPSFGGGIKANRCLLEALARRGHDCLALTRALTRSTDGPQDLAQLAQQLGSRGVVAHSRVPHVYAYDYRGVAVDALDFAEDPQRGDYLTRRLATLAPDWVLVTDDKRRITLPAALRAAPRRVILLLQTIIQLPFGPLAVRPDAEYAALIRQARAIIVISDFLQQYMLQHGGLSARRLPIPVYGDGPFPDLSRFDAGYVTMINPCALKGLPIFVALARELPKVKFAAVPTWGADASELDRLTEMPNVRILPTDDDIERILAQTRVLVVPSLWSETFGYVVPEAMLRGIPVLASNVGGLPEAKLGVDYLLDVSPGAFRDGRFVCPPQDIGPWARALRELLSDASVYQVCSRESRRAAHEFVASVSAAPFEALMDELAAEEA
jgi:glycosyltransferase involved in cell wall biosynthesis